MRAFCRASIRQMEAFVELPRSFLCLAFLTTALLCKPCLELNLQPDLNSIQYPTKTSPLSFAGSGCIPCPEHGHCESGLLTCAVGYEKVGRHCVKDKRVEARVHKLAGKVKRFVCQQRGLALCGYNTSEAVPRAHVMGMLGEGQVRVRD